mmetsp:Transcript_25474/g.38936  ORF Transcript_25474/g.38936 Transcript_25474/m.38936 type:complete len:99 (-) Transcript_25474:13-309(-)
MVTVSLSLTSMWSMTHPSPTTSASLSTASILSYWGGPPSAKMRVLLVCVVLEQLGATENAVAHDNVDRSDTILIVETKCKNSNIDNYRRCVVVLELFF